MTDSGEPTPPDAEPAHRRHGATGPNWGRVIALFAWLGFLGLFVAVGARRASTRAWPTRTSRGARARSSS